MAGQVTAKSATLAEIAKALSEPKRYLVTAHSNPDADAYGSSCGLALALRARGATAAILNESPLHSRYAFIPGAQESVKQVPPGAWDAVVVLDCGTLERTGDKLKGDLKKFSPIINIDHHVSNDFFGDLNYVDETACSTSELVLRVLQELKFKLTAPVATALLVGVYGDTGSFRHSSTSAGVFQLAGKLTEAGADPHFIAENLYSRNSVGAVKLQSEALRAMQFYEQGRVAEVIVTKAMFETFGASREDVEELVERARDVSGVEIAVLIREEGDFWKTSLRSSAARFDVSKLAGEFGGGGHKVAAGFRWRKGLDELKSSLHAKLAELLKR